MAHKPVARRLALPAALAVALWTALAVAPWAGAGPAVGAETGASSLLTSGAPPRTVLPLSQGRRLPVSWPAPGPMVRAWTGPPAGAPSGTRNALDAQVSANWSGYIDTGAHARFTQVSAMWTVPAVSRAGPGDSATWVGIDGFANNDLVQAGTDQTHGSYYAWYELIPEYAFSLGKVNPGDRMYVDVADEVPGTWTVTVEDVTKGVTWTGPVAYYAAGTSAEWIEEAPSTGRDNTIETLADFNSVEFSDMAVGGPGTAEAHGAPVYLVNDHNLVEAYPSQYDPGTDSLRVSYGSPVGGIVGYPAVPITGGATSTTTTTPAAPAPPRAHGYWLAESDGDITAFGAAGYYGSPVAMGLARPVTGMAATPDDQGYWLVTSDGGVFAYGDARYYGSLPALGMGPAGGPKRPLNAPVVGMAPTPDGSGYYLVASDGGVFAFGDAHFQGSCTTTLACPARAVAIVPDLSGQGYWLLLADAEMVSFGDAPRVTDGDCQSLAAQDRTPAVAAARTVGGAGYWVVLRDGTTCAEGDALTEGIWEAQGPTDQVSNPAVAIVTDRAGLGAWLVMKKGNVDRYGDAPQLDDLNGDYPPYPVVAAAGF